MVRAAQGMVIVSLNAHPDIIKLFDGLHMETRKLNHTVGGAGGTPADELMIWNHNVEARL